MKSIKDLSRLRGRVYVHLSNAEIGDLFLRQAESEGFTFTDGTLPTSRSYDEVMAVNPDLTLNFIGAIGHIAYGSGIDRIGNQKLIRIEYLEYLKE